MACSSKGRIVILGQIVSASGQIFRSDFRPQDEIFRPGMPFRLLDEQALSIQNRTKLSKSSNIALQQNGEKGASVQQKN